MNSKMSTSEKVFCLLCLLCLSFLSLSCSLTPSDEGVCVVKISSPRTRTRHYTTYTNRMCGKKKCQLKRTKKEKYTVTINQTVCCNGWEYLSDEDKCAPLCSTGCAGGRCVSPEVCVCEPPSHLDPHHPNTCLQPTCDHPCTGGICGLNNTCHCNIGYRVFNATHCMPQCDEGYRNDPSSLACTPRCDSCANETCTAPNTCTCSEGFRSSDGTCQPICDPPCENAECIGVDTCSCRRGFEESTEKWRCVPKCDSCDNGHCVGPGHCECNEGFSSINGTCRPECIDPCVNGYCSAPGVCSCDDGFVKNGTTVSPLSEHLHVTVCYKPCGECNGTCNAKGECVPSGGCQTATYQQKTSVTLLCVPLVGLELIIVTGN